MNFVVIAWKVNYSNMFRLMHFSVFNLLSFSLFFLCLAGPDYFLYYLRSVKCDVPCLCTFVVEQTKMAV